MLTFPQKLNSCFKRNCCSKVCSAQEGGAGQRRRHIYTILVADLKRLKILEDERAQRQKLRGAVICRFHTHSKATYVVFWGKRSAGTLVLL